MSVKDVLRNEIKEILIKFMEKSGELNKTLGTLIREVNNEVSNRCFIYNVGLGVDARVTLWIKCEEAYIIPIDKSLTIDEMIDKAETYNPAKVDKHFIPLK